MFQKVCKGNKCVIIESPPMSDLNGNFYRIGHDDEMCYQYVPRIIDCSEDGDDEEETENAL